MINLIQGDCLEKLKELPDNSVDMVLTDPPYGTTACKWDTVIPFEPMWKELKRIRKENSAICLFGSEPFSSALRMSNIKEFKYDWIWRKNRVSGIFNAKKMPMKNHEVISVFYTNLPTYNFLENKVKREEKAAKRLSYGNKRKSVKSKLGRQYEIDFKFNEIDKNLSYAKTVLNFDGVPTGFGVKQLFHPTQKPVALLEYLIKTYTKEGDTVLDFTMGSGSTGVAAKNLNRKFIGIELDQQYFEIAKNRINKLQLELSE